MGHIGLRGLLEIAPSFRSTFAPPFLRNSEDHSAKVETCDARLAEPSVFCRRMYTQLQQWNLSLQRHHIRSIKATSGVGRAEQEITQCCRTVGPSIGCR